MKNTKEKIIKTIFFLNGLLVVVVLCGIFGLLVFTALPAFKEINIVEFLTSTRWNPTSYEKETYGIVSMLVSTFMVTLGALTFSIPLGIGTAAYLSDIASPRKREIIKPIIEILAGIPSVVLGFLGMALPTIISISEDALNSVPSSFTHASMALGATKWQTLIRVKIPAACSGIIAACMLGMGRAIGETMTVLMACGNAPAMPKSFLTAVRTMTASIAIELGEVPYYTTHYYALFGIGLMLFIITFCVNLVADIVLHKHQKMQR